MREHNVSEHPQQRRRERLGNFALQAQITLLCLAFAPSFQRRARKAQNISVCKGPANKRAAIRHLTRLRWRGGPAPAPAPSVAIRERVNSSIFPVVVG